MERLNGKNKARNTQAICVKSGILTNIIAKNFKKVNLGHLTDLHSAIRKKLSIVSVYHKHRKIVSLIPRTFLLVIQWLF